MNTLTAWFKRTLADPQIVYLSIALIVGFAIVLSMGEMLAPALAGVVIAYLLEGLVRPLERARIPRLLAVIIVFLLFLALVLLLIFGMLPQISVQATQLIQELPSMLARGQELLMTLPHRYPEIVSTEQVDDVIRVIKGEIGVFGQRILSLSLSSVVGLITIMVYAILVPLLVFFFLKDKDRIFAWFGQMLPRDNHLAKRVWSDVDAQIGNYVRGKFWEIFIIWATSALTFSIMGLQYSMLLGMLVGLSVIIPYIGAAVVTIPVLAVAYFQWGWHSDFFYLSIAYFVIQAIDGNVLVPLLFSEVVNLHPVAIIVAILFFGGLWGFWGVFFAIPLATLVQAVLRAWPRTADAAAGTNAPA
ncbi:MAG: AI-2E family transporter [Chromatiales bacterium]|nr:AI-2E family transporter [Chromatiales bacterium]